MLARLLRGLLATQLITGALLGWFLSEPSDNRVWIVIIGALGFPLLTALALTIKTAIQSRAPGASAMWWRSLPGEYVAGIRLFLLQQPWTIAPPQFQPAMHPTANKVPVLLVHGYISNHRVWDEMASALRSAGHPVLTLDLEPLFTSIDNYGPLIEEAVSELCRQTGVEKVALIGHSMGGLVIRAWIRSHGHDRVAMVITLGTPHAGTQIGPHPNTPNGQQMIWHSDWLHALSASETRAIRQLIRIALSPQDNIVAPQREQVLEGAQVTVFDGLGHLALCLNSAVTLWVLRQLEDTQRP